MPAVPTRYPAPIHRSCASHRERPAMHSVRKFQAAAISPTVHRTIEAHTASRDDPPQAGQELSADVVQLVQAALDALPTAVFLIEGGMRVLHANVPAIQLTSCATSALSMASDRSQPGDFVLVARERTDQSRLCDVVSSAAGGGSGGALRLQRRGTDSAGRTRSLIVRVSPIFANSWKAWPPVQCQAVPGVAVIIARDPQCSLPPSVELMTELYGLSRAEAEVASRLAGAVTANHVARDRGVSLETIRSQIKMILQKTNAANLRELERLMALTSSVYGPD